MIRIIFGLLVLFVYCQNNNEKIQSENELATANQNSFTLQKPLREISGLACDTQGRLFAHNDEKAIVFELDTVNFQIIKKFYVGKMWAVESDFEGLAITPEYFYLVNSSGKIFEFKEGNNEELVEFSYYKSGLTSRNNIEGLCFDENTNSLLLACKEYPGKKYNDKRAVYSFSLDTYKTNKKPFILIDLKELSNDHDLKSFYPSGIEFNKTNQSYLIVSARGGPAIVEVNLDSEILNARPLKKKRHRQPEAVTFLESGQMLIADEAAGAKPKITKY